MGKYDDLVNKAFEAMENAYAPYSKFHVGACVLCSDGTTFKGCNIENASFGATNCAERSAVFSAYSNGYQKDKIVAIAIVSDGDRLAAPCGICRQVLNELLKKGTPVILATKKDYMETTIQELLPMSFEIEDVIR